MNEDIAVIANITEQEWLVHRTYGTFRVRGCAARAGGASPAPTQDTHQGSAGNGGAALAAAPQPATTHAEDAGCGYALTVITERTGKIDLGDNRATQFPIRAREIAEDIAREINSDGGEGSDFGVFVCAGEAPSAAELSAARARLEAFYVRLVAAADREWERSHNHIMINDVQRRAARALGLDKEWAYDPAAQITCPACGSKIKAGLAVCRVCDAVLDREKALRFGILRDPPATEPRTGQAPALHSSEARSRL